jgi:hypothetical protein
MTYPNGRVLDYTYDGGIDGVDDRVSRLSGLAEDQGGSSVTLEGIDYLGLNTLVGRRHGESGIDLVYYGESPASGTDPYTGFDRFGRVIDQRWVDTTPATGTSWSDVDRYAYGYDRNGNRLYEENLLSAAHSELYHDGTGYDGLDRLTSFERGTLNPAKDGLTGAAERYQDWTLDAVGNWDAFDDNGTSQTRDHDRENRLTEVTEGGTDDDFHHSKNGEIVEAFGIAGTNVFIYDAWGRLAGFDSDYGTAGVGETDFEYDALNRRMVSDGELHYHTKGWQVIEERDAATGVVGTQYVWSPAYVDAMVLRDRNADASTDGSVEERLYVLHDANFNVTAIVAETQPDEWNVVKRYLLDPYGGNRVVLAGDWSLVGTGFLDTSGNAMSAYAFEHGFQSGRHLQYTNDQRDVLVHFRNRDLLTRAGRWMRQDPAGYVDGASLYQAHVSNIVSLLDPFGLDSTKDEGEIAALRNRAEQHRILQDMIDSGEYDVHADAELLNHERQRIEDEFNRNMDRGGGGGGGGGGGSPDPLTWFFIDSTLGKALSSLDMARANAFAQVGATIGEVPLTLFARVPAALGSDVMEDGLRRNDLLEKSLWERVQEEFNKGWDDIWN